MAVERISSIVNHLTPGTSGLSAITSKNADDIVITLAVRTPLAKGFKGGFKDTKLDYLIYSLLQKVREKSNLDPALVEDVCCGNVSDGNAAYKLRAAVLAAGFPNTTAASIVNRFCSSGLKATQDIANQIAEGSIDIGIAMGAEMMSVGGDKLDGAFHLRFSSAKKLQIQDRYAAESYNRAELAQKAGWDQDMEQLFESLNKIRPAFPDFGDRSTGGNSSQVTDGAAAVLLMKRSRAIELGQPILAKFVGATVAGLAPRIMGIGPSIAVPKLLSKYKITIDDCDVIELNEAFASMAVYCKDALKIPHEKLNIRGGAIALGHPLVPLVLDRLLLDLASVEDRRRRFC
ncbi:hypothetical protein DID88_005360 [Monilinia fructigena]|uniref:Thiolase N-terminal domain-containing protein n=1 Tax=Monilinia fructigena TaxID=38457 RepID=A0A395IZM9_9HELO|nr:hypothetical protein DID88_005360 [Monilinia fructigena]